MAVNVNQLDPTGLITVDRKMARVDLKFFPNETFAVDDIELVSEGRSADLSGIDYWVVNVTPKYAPPFQIPPEYIRVDGGKMNLVFPKSLFEKAYWKHADYKVQSVSGGEAVTWFGGKITLKR